MKICVNCKKEMSCENTGAIIVFKNDHCYSVDIFKCNKCGNKVAISGDLQVPFHANSNILKSRKGAVIVDMS